MSQNKKTQASKSTYGPTLKTDKAEEFAMNIFAKSREEKLAGRGGMPLCAWGDAGIGKTELPKFLVKKYTEFFGGNIVYVPLGQIEEKAELQGLPDIKEFVRDFVEGEDETLLSGDIEIRDGKKVVVDVRTVYATPSWIPQVETHGERGLLVIDDATRADSRIINSIMQLLQDHELLGWKLPIGWEIYLTCNPDNGKYQVTRLDGAQMTRMVNFEQAFDPISWATNWGTPTGLHPLALNFVLAVPEAVCQGDRTNPRSFDKFFRLAADCFDEPGDNIEAIRTYGMMNIDEIALGTFITFITDGFGKLPDVEDILSGQVDLDQLRDKLTIGGNIRVDILNTLSCRLVIYINQNGITDKQCEHMKKWLKHSMVPKEIRYKDTVIAIKKNRNIGDPELAKLLYQR